MKASHDVQTYVVSALVVLFGVAGLLAYSVDGR
jgi:hypothetical protein